MADTELRNTAPRQGEGKEIELRPEKQRRVIEEIPRPIVVWGTVSVIVILSGLLLAILLIPYPYSDGESILHHLFRQLAFP